MPKVNISSVSNLPPQTAYSKVTAFLESDPDLKKLDPGYSCEWNQDDLSGTAKGNMFSARMEVKENGDGSEVFIHVELPIALALAKGMVQSTLQSKLDKSLSN